jgi:hypothetical protein
VPAIVHKPPLLRPPAVPRKTSHSVQHSTALVALLCLLNFVKREGPLRLLHS